jgi:hypothetical protein
MTLENLPNSYLEVLLIIFFLIISFYRDHDVAKNLRIVCLNSKFPPPVELRWQNKNIS